MNNRIFADKIVQWYYEHQRKLPWRETRDPYKIWLSEIILQQTRVVQGLPYFTKFMDRFPDVFALARASEQEVLRLWQGLGYYSRARNLHKCASIIANLHQGHFPESAVELEKLPGIGAYTAAAIASFAFLEPIATLDGNVYRVLARIFGIEQDILSPEGKRQFSKLANSLIPKGNPDAFNQAMMEFGATQCVPVNPDCSICILHRQCVAFEHNWQDRLPIKSKRPKIRRRYFYYFVIRQKKKWLLQKRSARDIWLGLYDFYLVETTRPRNPEHLFEQDKVLQRLSGKIHTEQISGVFKHLLTHQRLMARFVPVTLLSSRKNQEVIKSNKLKFYSSKEMERLPKPVLVNRYMLENDIL